MTEARTPSRRPRWVWPIGLIAIAFGLATIVSGGRVVFDVAGARESAGAYVGFVVWFNFIAGFAYVIAGAGLIAWRAWGAQLSALIAGATLLVFLAFAAHALSGGGYEARTAAAMTLRLAVWVAIAVLACRALGCRLRAA